jgi:FMN-dependent NADH-azoreductase
MAEILVLSSSTSRDDPVSRLLVEQAMARFTEAYPEPVTVRRDFGPDRGPHLAVDGSDPKTDMERAMRLISDALIACALPTSS